MSDGSSNPRALPDKLLDMLGPIASPLKANFVLAGVLLASALVALLSTRLWLVDGKTNPHWMPWVFAFGVAAAIAVALDRIADANDKRSSYQEYSGSEFTAESSVAELNVLLAEIIEVAFLRAGSRATALSALRRDLVRCAAHSIGPGTRATYYSLNPASRGHRVLGDPQHSVTVGRSDKPDRPFKEDESPTHDVWKILDGPDEKPEVRNESDDVNDLDWAKKPYKTFLSVPVKAQGTVFGLLSVNNSNAGSIGRAQRATILAMARSMAAALALEARQHELADSAKSGEMS